MCNLISKPKSHTQLDQSRILKLSQNKLDDNKLISIKN